jgi:diguanylate cyclase (GGDEF)-like protein/PAS domain S-box-containing protein
MPKPAKPPKNEQLRLALLKQLMVLDSESEPLFNEITKLASQICGTPIALISLIDENRQWFKANIGLENATETHRDLAFCAHAILENNLFEINDATQDNRFQNNPLVTSDPNIRFYAGMPLTMANGLNIGTLCVIDREPRSLSQEQKNMLAGLAEITCKALLSREKNIYELHDKAEVLAAIINSSNDAIISKTLGGIITSWNTAAEKIFGYKSKEVIGQHIGVLFPNDKVDEEELLINQIINNQSVSHFETTRLTKNKQAIQVSISLSPIKNAQGEIVGASKIVRDITRTKHLQQKLALEHERLRVTMDSIGDAVITTDNAGVVQYINPAAESLTGWSQHDAVGQPLVSVFNIIHETTRQRCLNPVELCLAENRIVGLAQNTVLISRDGKEYGIEDSAAPIRDHAGNTLGVVLVFHDVSQQRIMANEISYRATHDSLTGLYNRSEFENILSKSIQSPKAPDAMDALMFLDLDRFKIVNDTCGHAAGDRLLIEITGIIQNCIRNNDTFARIGGDEFSILLEKCNVEKAHEIATLICQSVDNYRFLNKNQKFRIGTSIGLVVIDQHTRSTSEILQAADNACYGAKSAGRNRVHLHYNNNPSLTDYKKETQWINRIEQALEENRFTLFCQRILPLNHIGKEHAEILLRLIDENGKIIEPSVFIPAAERFHMMSRIDRWVVKNAFDWLQRNDASLSHIDAVSINLSGQSLGDKDFHGYVEQLINSMSLDCSKICFEITETVAITNIANASVFFKQMKQHGVRLSLDDFGSGVSSFSYLKNLPVDYLKIDGQFIKDLIENQIGQATVKCMTEVARITNKQTIAEWVDNVAVETMLKEMKVDFTQGYLKHMPAPIDFLTKIKCEYMPESVA